MLMDVVLVCLLHCVKNVRIRSFSGPYFSTFGPNTEGYSVSLRIRSECRKMWTRKTPNTDTLHAVLLTLEKYLPNEVFLIDAIQNVKQKLHKIVCSCAQHQKWEEQGQEGGVELKFI